MRRRRQVARRKRPAQQPVPQFQATYHRQGAVKQGRGGINYPLWITGVVFVLLISGFFWLGSIAEVEVSGVDNAPVVSNQAQEEFTFQWQVSEARLRQLPALSELSIAELTFSRPWWQRTLVVTITPYEPVLAWQSGERLYLIDAAGIVTQAVEDSDLPKVVDAAQLPVEVNNQIAPRQFVDFVTRVASSELEWTTVRVLETTAELHVTLKSGYDVRFATGEDLDTQLDNLRRVQAQAKESGERIEEYVDVRLPYKAYYR